MWFTLVILKVNRKLIIFDHWTYSAHCRLFFLALPRITREAHDWPWIEPACTASPNRQVPHSSPAHRLIAVFYGPWAPPRHHSDLTRPLLCQSAMLSASLDSSDRLSRCDSPLGSNCKTRCSHSFHMLAGNMMRAAPCPSHSSRWRRCPYCEFVWIAHLLLYPCSALFPL